MHSPSIVVVDDDEAITTLLQDVLREQGHRVVGCQTSAECALLLAAERPALLVLDLRMEGSYTGLAILQAVRENRDTAALPCIMCSADTTYLREHGDELRARGCEPLPKPFAIDDLITLVQRLLPTCV
jgi:DNA-binding NtrC family response regulator